MQKEEKMTLEKIYDKCGCPVVKQQGTLHRETCKLCDASSSVVYLHSICHPEAPTWAKWNSDALIIECAECKKEVTRFGFNKD